VHTKFKTSFSHAIKSKAIVKLLLKNIAKKLNKSDKVYTVSNDMAAELNSYGYKGDVQVVRNGAMFEKVQNLSTLKESSRKFLNISQNEIVFLFVGRIVRIKNLEFIVNALKLVEQKMPDFKMIFVGDGVDLKYMKQYVTDIGLANKVIFTGQVTNKTTISALYSSADLFVFPSIFDNDPLTVVEAAVHKVPSLTLENTGSSERITDGISGFTCENDVNKFADKIISIVNDKEKLKAVGENAEKMIPKSWDQTASEYVEIYKNAIMEKSALKAENKDKKKQKSAKKKKSLENA
ncbi:MAG: glycosyltransferase, partial [Clostridia bacterium]|nr:glycosyltransferase [Clostridia bacterium]